MDLKKLRVWIRLKLGTIDAAREACLDQGDIHHQKGREDVPPKDKAEEWAEAERYHAAAKDIRDAQHETVREPPYVRNSSDDSIHGNSAPVQVTRFTLPKDAREILVAIILSISVLGNVLMWVSYRQLQQTVDLDRYDDNTFINGRFADLKVEVEAHEKLIQAYGLQKSLKDK